MDDSTAAVLTIILCIFLIGVISIGMTVDRANDLEAHYACVNAGIPSDRGLSYMEGVRSNHVVCIAELREELVLDK